MKDLFFNWTTVVGLIGIASFIAFALPPSPPWLSWPALALSGLCGWRVMIVGDRRHTELQMELELDDENPHRKRTDELVRLLSRKRR